jgi:hypothetical protein
MLLHSPVLQRLLSIHGVLTYEWWHVACTHCVCRMKWQPTSRITLANPLTFYHVHLRFLSSTLLVMVDCFVMLHPFEDVANIS